MPAKNILKQYVPGGFYHIYNRGSNKQNIFIDNLDRSVFLNYLKTYLLPKDTRKLTEILSSSQSSSKDKNKALGLLSLNNFFQKIELIAFCLMPNHYHFLVHQKDEKDIESFMRSAMTKYTAYFNKRHQRVGPLFQGKYKAVLIESEEQLLHLSRYIHRNPQDIEENLISETTPSSYGIYLKKAQCDWVKPDIVLDYFTKEGSNSYEVFVLEKNFYDDPKVTIDLGSDLQGSDL